MRQKRYVLLYKWLQKHKTDYNWTYKKLADAMKTHTNNIYLYANGKSFPTLAKSIKLCKALAKVEASENPKDRFESLFWELISIAEREG
tara:strand:+ start:486 stop:752 length:267 start_codon:yes stop_codon:yes gene_type:complete